MICDDLGYGDLGCYGSRLPTPNLDAMAAAGAQFTRWNTPHPICSASRAALLTGRYGLRMNTAGAFGPNSPAGTSLDETLLSNLFHDKGYATKTIGKWHLGDKPAYLPTNRGFDSFLGVPWSDDFNPLPLIRDTQILEQNTDRDILTPRYTEEAVRFLEEPERGKQPFFLYLAFSYPHDPARASARFRDKTGFGHVGDSIAEIDWSVGEIMRAVEKQGFAKDTLILFTSDHGPW
jgi:arylsulfatase